MEIFLESGLDCSDFIAKIHSDEKEYDRMSVSKRIRIEGDKIVQIH